MKFSTNVFEGAVLRDTMGRSWCADARAALLAVLSLCFAPAALAQNQGVGSQGWDQRLYYSSDLAAPVNPIDAPSREYTGVPIGGWMVYASVLTGVVWDDNVFQASQSKTSDWGVRLKPSIEMIRNSGIHKTTIYGFVDGRIYRDEDDANVANGSIGVNHVWEVQRDLVVKADFDYSRRTDINNAGTLQTLGGPVTIVSPLEYDIFTGALSAQKSFDRIFVGLGAVVTHTNYADVTDTLGQTFEQDGRDHTVYTISSRLGAWVSPVIYAFIEPSQNWRRFRDSTFDSQGQRIIAGIGTDRVSLFRGEVFAGYQRQDYDNAAIDTINGSVLGGRLFWYPTRDLVIGLDADRRLTEATLPTPGNAFGSPVETTSIVLKADYILTDTWSASARLGYSLIDYQESSREDDQWQGGVTVSYFIWRNLAATFEWQYTDLQSNTAGNSFQRNIFTAGATYKY